MEPHEYVVGFYGDFGNYLEGFGCFVANDEHEFKEEEYEIFKEDVEVKPVEEDLQEESEEEQVEEVVEEEVIEDLKPDYDEEWREGSFTVNINHAVILSESLGLLLNGYNEHFRIQFDALGDQLI